MSEAHGALESTNSSSVNLVVDVVGERTHFQGELVRYTVVLTNPTTASITLSWCRYVAHSPVAVTSVSFVLATELKFTKHRY